MKNATILPEDPAFLFTLALLRRPAGSRALAQFLERDEAAVLDRLCRLRQTGVVACGKERRSWRASCDLARKELGAAGTLFAAGKDAGPLTTGLGFLWGGDLIGGGRLLVPTVKRLAYAGRTPGALAGLDILFHTMASWEAPARSPEENEQFLHLCISIVELALFLVKRRRRAKALFAVAISVANSLGNRRSGLQLRLMQVCFHSLIGGMLPEDAQTALDAMEQEIQELGDTDTVTGSAHAMGIQNHLKGAFTAVLDTYRQYPGHEGECCNSIALANVALSACNLGRFGHAIGVVTHALRRHGEMGGEHALARTRILGGDVLLRAGMPDKALEMMDEAWTCCDGASEPYFAVWGLRNLAFYHFQMQHMVYAHRMLSESAALAAAEEFHQPFRWFPSIFEMLWTFQELGLPPIPGHGLEEHLDMALKAACEQSQGIALRIRARQLIKNRNINASLLLLEASLAKLVKCANPVEQARTMVVLGTSLEAAGRHEEAREMRAKGCATLEEYQQYDRFGLCLAKGPPTRRKTRTAGAECAGAWRDAFAETADWATFESHIQGMIDCLRDALRVERVALFCIKNNYELVCLAARDFTEKERHEKIPAMYGKRMLDCMRSGSIMRWRSRYGACLCLPLHLSKKRHAVFFAQNAYMVDSIIGRGEKFFEPIRSLLEEEVHVAYRIKDSVNALQRREEELSRLAAERLVDAGGIYYGPAMQEVLEQADKASPTTAPVLVLGETGTGKEELSRRVHRKSGRPGPFIPVNAASIPEQLFESELFGHEKGAFTDAHQQKIGLLELAHKGTLFIDEIGDIPLALQVKLLRVLQDGKFSRLGGTTLVHSDFRLVSATHQNLAEKIREGVFREDFYYRIAVVPLTMPPLRDRPEDIRHLAILFHRHFASLYQKELPPLANEELEYLCARPWPGNVRELRSFIERGVILFDPAQGGFTRELPEELQIPPRSPDVPPPDAQPDAPWVLFGGDDLPSLEELQRRYIRHVLELTRGKVGGKGGAQEILEVKLSSLYKKMKKYGLDKTTLIYGNKEE